MPVYYVTWRRSVQWLSGVQRGLDVDGGLTGAEAVGADGSFGAVGAQVAVLPLLL